MTRFFCLAIVLGLLASCAPAPKTQIQSSPSTPAPSPDGFSSTDTVRGKLNQAQQNGAQRQQEMNQMIEGK